MTTLIPDSSIIYTVLALVLHPILSGLIPLSVIFANIIITILL